MGCPRASFGLALSVRAVGRAVAHSRLAARPAGRGGRARRHQRRRRWPRPGKEFGVERLSTDYRALIDADDIDVIDVVTGNAAHWPVTLAALEAGKHVLCEKPVHHDYRMVARRPTSPSPRV